LQACAHASAAHNGPGSVGALDAPKLWSDLQAAHAKPTALTAEGKIFVDAPENGGRYSLHVSVRRPESLRIEALTPLGDPAAVLVADAGRMAIFDLRRNEFYRGSSTPQNLSRLFPVPFSARDLVAVFLGAVPDVGAPVSVSREGDHYVYVLSDGGALLAHQDGRVLEVRTARFRLVLEEHDGLVPTIVKLSVPEQKIALDLRLKSLLVDKPPPFGAFALEPPKGVKIVDLD
jgi:hypothetical protein